MAAALFGGAAACGGSDDGGASGPGGAGGAGGTAAGGASFDGGGTGGAVGGSAGMAGTAAVAGTSTGGTGGGVGGTAGTSGAAGGAGTGGANPDCVEAGADGTFCVCGCGQVDPDCPVPASVDDCDWDGCDSAVERPDEADPSQCKPIDFPAGWTCGAADYVDDVFYFVSEMVTRNSCTCGCGAVDDRGCATAPAVLDDCESDGCGDGFAPDANDLTRCVALPAGWTCSWERYYDDDCDCGCGIADPMCPASPHISECDDDACPSGESPDPTNVTQCIANAPQDGWTCDILLLNDGSQCDCGCGAVDTDCPAAATASDCDTTHCKSSEELDPATIAKCREKCEPASGSVGSATCTNGGTVSIGSACVRDLYACTDGNRYEIECSGGECLCRINNSCVSRHSGSGCVFSTCGWSLIDAT